MQIHQLIHLYNHITALNEARAAQRANDRALAEAKSNLDAMLPSLGEGLYGESMNVYVNDERITHLVKREGDEDGVAKQLVEVLEALHYRTQWHREEAEKLARSAEVYRGAAVALQGYIDSVHKEPTK